MTGFERGLELLRRGRFWHAHEEWEREWQVSRDPQLRGLIQLAAALFHLRRGNEAGARRVYARALDNLSGSPWRERVPPLEEWTDLRLRAARDFLLPSANGPKCPAFPT